MKAGYLKFTVATFLRTVCGIGPLSNRPDGTCVVATTNNGTLCGTHLPGFGQDVFLGVPYAEPPLGPLRLRHPRSYRVAYESLSVTESPPSCPGYAGFDIGIGPLSEDCLYMNIVRPSRRHSDDYEARESLPVLVWIYGGGFDAGGISDPRYNMSYMVNQSVAIGKPIIGVSINYRVGGWGFLASREIFNDSASNIGLYDQRLALRYIQENIARFGGDPRKVTIWGESAGAFSVGYHLIAFNGHHDNLFRAAILESGTALGQAMQTKSQVEAIGGYQELYDNVTRTTGCAKAIDSLQCLRELPFAVLDDAFRPQVYTPVIDGNFISRLPSESFASGLVADIAVLVGSNTDEGTATFWGPRGTLYTSENVRAWLRTLNEGGLTEMEVEELLELYPDDPAKGCPFDTGDERFADQGWQYKRGAAVATDLNIAAGRRATAEFFAQRQTSLNNPVYSYRFDQPPWNGKEELIATVPPVFSTHYSELGFVFNNPSEYLSYWIGPSQDCYELSLLMSRSWTSFAHSLDPNHHKLLGMPYWPQYRVHRPHNILFRAMDRDNGTVVEFDTWRQEQLRWWHQHWNSLRT